MKHVETLTRLLEYGLQLKQMPRTGWVQRGIVGAENVAAHSYSVGLIVMALLESIDPDTASFDRYRVLQLALLHDLPEAITSDIPAPVKRLFPAEQRATLKQQIERNGMHEITAGLPFGANWNALWEEMSAAQTPESKLCHDADKLDMYLQAYQYEIETGNGRLAQFWQKRHTFHYAEAQAVYDLLVEKRQMT